MKSCPICKLNPAGKWRTNSPCPSCSRDHRAIHRMSKMPPEELAALRERHLALADLASAVLARKEGQSLADVQRCYLGNANLDKESA